MAVYKIFAEKDASIYSVFPTKNAGLDEILDLSLYHIEDDDSYESSRLLIKFPQDEINDIINNKVSGSGYDTYLKLYLANASEIPLDYSIECYPIYENWNMGTGRIASDPETTNGVSYSSVDGINAWLASYPVNVTASFNASGSGGGNWWTTYTASESFSYITSKDIEMNTTSIVEAWYTGSISNNGFILKHSASLEFQPSSSFELKYFSSDSHTIYPPCLEIRWDDSSFVTGSNSILYNDSMTIVLSNNKETYKSDSVHRFRLGVRKNFPVRTFQTSSIYTNNSILPATSYWSIKDYKTEDTIVDFDNDYTKISADSTGSFFDVYMNGLEPERYYRLVLKVVNGPQVQIFDENYIFKIVR